MSLAIKSVYIEYLKWSFLLIEKDKFKTIVLNYGDRIANITLRPHRIHNPQDTIYFKYGIFNGRNV